MLCYAAATAALRVLSVTPQTRWLYWYLGRTVGARRRRQRGLHSMYVDRARKFLALVRRKQIVQAGDRLLELGTGWMHWDATVLRLFYDVSITLFDVADIRQLDAYQRCFMQLRPLLASGFCADQATVERAQLRIDAIVRASSFDEIYEQFGFSYVTDRRGLPDDLVDNSFNLIFSANTLEHVDRPIIPQFVDNLYRICKPGGYSVQAIDLGDHIGYYDRSVSPKHYLRYSETIWQRYFENRLQYINRVQRPEWLARFRQAGFELLEEQVETARIDEDHIAPVYRNLSRQDLVCSVTTVVHRKPTK